MKVFILLFISVLSIPDLTAQQTTIKTAFLEKWDNSRDYLIAIAQTMPETHYNYKPTEREMTFKDQLIHIQDNMNWLSKTYFKANAIKKTSFADKNSTVESLRLSFDQVHQAILATPESELEEIVDFFAGKKSKLQILNLLQDHVTHHRGQLIVYLNLKDVKPPAYVGW